ncbi:sn-glycerol-3-phosphate ABC transporter ATP-binding protein UgpC [Synechococcales cyanobacterium C]|uniref:sn-glycerol-3-phosphate ABC transporter ATP-binding protein UgpC n=1 Tax=Petrachloros mirabilis ULC683 TaxID=2781853 RepID=A0A8K2ABV6_9CYAN|nr:ABC transporter ATP-binding protein [Petrachloros mirabilis]NCJ05160.1 sn-glycerol-3-phosphate ABC transporter ATP-binding protein UgpC [Petrachloros mirabilis ULC683]
MARVWLDNVGRQFNSTLAVAEISFEVPDGEFWVLVGPSGCGKSTILRMIAGLESITTGQIYIGDRLVNQVSARDRDVAMVFQNYALYPHMTVAENLAFGLKMRKAEPSTLRNRVQQVAQMLDLTHLLQRKPRQLSGGQQQRVALGRAIARQPQVFLLDEPLSNLDAQLRDDTRAQLKQLHSQVGVTTLYVTHDQTEAMTLADQVVVLFQGKIQQIGPPQQIYQFPANRMVATFLGSPPANLLRATCTANGLRLGSAMVPYPTHLHGLKATHLEQTIDLGLRPEHVQVLSPDRPGHLSAAIAVVEPLGRETLIRATLTEMPEQSLNLVTAVSMPFQAGDRLSLNVVLSQLMAFDATTGAALLPHSCNGLG